MAEAIQFTCSVCARAIVVWSDGNLYYRDENGRKRHAYHPYHEALARCIGNDVPHLCLACGRETTVDSERPPRHCRRCRTGTLIPTWELAGQRCPTCREGSFVASAEPYAIS